MPQRADLPARAVEQVLRAERTAEAEVERARAAAEEAIARARREAQRISARADGRITRMRVEAEKRTAEEIARMRTDAEADSQRVSHHLRDPNTIAQAVSELAAWLLAGPSPDPSDR